jgi:hypothetical protein
MQDEDATHGSEVLVVLQPDAAPGALASLKNQYQVTSVLPPRIAVVSGGGSMEQINNHPGVEAVLVQPSDEDPPSLNDAERLFVSAWRTRQHAEGKIHVGEGLPWDAPGFLPPDEPKRK